MAKGRFLLQRSTMTGVDAVEAETDHVFPRHTHEEFGIGVIRRGAQKSASGRGMVEAGPGNVITVNPGEVHDGAPIGDRGRAWRMLYFDPSVITGAVGDIVEDSRDCEFRFPVLANAEAAAIFGRLYALATKQTEGSRIESESLLLSLVRMLISEGPAKSAGMVSTSIRRARALIDDCPTDDLTLGDLAHVAGLSRFQLLRGFTRMTGLTPHAYLMQKRTDLARRLIRRGNALADAAAASGFADQSHMTRAFAKRYGITPGAYAAALA
jgi:AraC-like DNA-binding protein